MKRIQKISWLIFPIVTFAAVIRLYRLDSVPPAPYWEEVALGYDAYSIAQTGKDHHGNSYPIIAFPSYGDYKPSGYFYAIIPFVKLLGLSVFAVRLPSALAGILSVALLYLIGKELFDEKTGLIAATVLAISPWAIQFSRGGWEVNFALMLILVGTFFLLKAKRQPWYLLGSVVFFALSMYTYHAARLFAPMIGGIGGVWVLFSWYKESRKIQNPKSKTIKIVILIFSVILLASFLYPLVSNLENKEVSSRFTDTSIFSNVQPVLDSNAAIVANGGTRVAKIVYHRYWYYGAIIFKQWASHFSPSFLFVRGDGNYRHGGWTGLLYPIEGFFIIISLCFLFLQSLFKYKNIQKAESWALIACIVWLGLAALAPALVTPAPHALRDLFAIPAYGLLIAVGISTLISLIPKRLKTISSIVIIAIYLFCFTSYFSQYLAIYPVKAQSDWQYGYEALFSQIQTYKQSGEQVYVSRKFGRPAMYYLFYSAYDPKRLQAIETFLPKDQLELLQVDDYHFVDGVPAGSGLFALPTGTPVSGGKIIGNVVGLDGLSIWTLWRK